MLETILNLYKENPIWQTLWLFAFIITLIGFLQKEDKKLYSILIIANIFWIVHFSIMWLFTWAAVNALNIFRNFRWLKFKKNKKIILILIWFYVFAWIMLYNKTSDILPIFAWILWVLSFVYFHWLKWRIVLLTGTCLWLLYNIIWGSIWGITTEMFMILASTITIIRLIKDKKNKNTLFT